MSDINFYLGLCHDDNMLCTFTFGSEYIYTHFFIIGKSGSIYNYARMSHSHRQKIMHQKESDFGQ